MWLFNNNCEKGLTNDCMKNSKKTEMVILILYYIDHSASQHLLQFVKSIIIDNEMWMFFILFHLTNVQ